MLEVDLVFYLVYLSFLTHKHFCVIWVVGGGWWVGYTFLLLLCPAPLDFKIRVVIFL